MDTSWWPALVAVVVIALVVAVTGGRSRTSVRTRPPGRPSRRPSGRTRPPARKPAGKPGARGPRAREIWWAEVPFEDGPGSKDRPCLVLSVRRDSALVAKITSKYHDERAGVIALPPGSVGDARGRASFLETDELRDVPLGEFRRRVGEADPVVWDQVRHLAR
ncbi:type II toxin-antitoxin system PemK/MazF family toxin [Streptomyces roseolus]|uniref:type II toxin-antitoxin system PemK/MazF family toxin n=1 Tax=Streptomyces roseolus TaxID=67358 RepID=UPI001673C057|nr:type II toxin-antitoxin system PemK/MazF family toxin [Streptomyces roseolus]